MRDILEAIERSAVRINDAIKKSDGSYSDNQNSTGDTQLKLDVLGDVIIEEEFKSCKSIKSIISEEKESMVDICESGKYFIGYDPVDGSSLVDVNQSVGSIFGIYDDVSFSGASLKASVYILYGARVDLVIAKDDVTQLYRLSSGKFEFIKNLTLNEKGEINATGGTQKEWLEHHQDMVDKLFLNGYKLEYCGGMVPDLHNILMNKGGLFSYPSMKDAPKGKLRIIFEVFPFAHIFESAGGKATDGVNRLLDFTPEHLHDTIPCFFGSSYEIEEVKNFYAGK
jgi:fructose-1,6-bisphosphatase I